MRTTSLKDPCLILIVDDDSFIRMQLRLCLEKEGYWVTEVKNGEDAIVIVSGESRWTKLLKTL